MKKSIAGVVVLYYPDEKELLRNILSYLPFIDKLFVIDNTGQDALTVVREKLLGLQNTEYIANKVNEGIAAALNKGAAVAIENGYNWLLTMDQDSFFEEGEAAKYFSFFETNFFHTDKIALVAPSHFRDKAIADKEVYSDLVSVLTSGSLLRLSTWKELDGYDEKLFIDEVDHEYCYRLKKKGYKIVQMNHIFLNHQLGSQKEAGYFGNIAKRSRTIHSPGRVYFMVRNYLYVRKEYRKFFRDEFRERDKALLVTLKNNLFFSGKFTENLENVRKAYIDFKKGNFHNDL
jgi:rhamnosyltransferase